MRKLSLVALLQLSCVYGDEPATRELEVSLRIDAVAPTSIPLRGGPIVTVFGANFDENVEVTVGSTIAPSLVVRRSGEILEFAAPALPPGPQTVTLRNPNGDVAAVEGLTYAAEEIRFDTGVKLEPTIEPSFMGDLDGDGRDELLTEELEPCAPSDGYDSCFRHVAYQTDYAGRLVRSAATEPTALNGDLGPKIAGVLDVDGDGLVDIVDFRFVHLGTGNGRFRPALEIPALKYEQGTKSILAVHLGQADYLEGPELFVLSSTTASGVTVLVLRLQSNGQFLELGARRIDSDQYTAHLAVVTPGDEYPASLVYLDPEENLHRIYGPIIEPLLQDEVIAGPYDTVPGVELSGGSILVLERDGELQSGPSVQTVCPPPQGYGIADVAFVPRSPETRRSSKPLVITCGDSVRNFSGTPPFLPSGSMEAPALYAIQVGNLDGDEADDWVFTTPTGTHALFGADSGRGEMHPHGGFLVSSRTAPRPESAMLAAGRFGGRERIAAINDLALIMAGAPGDVVLRHQFDEWKQISWMDACDFDGVMNDELIFERWGETIEVFEVLGDTIAPMLTIDLPLDDHAAGTGDVDGDGTCDVFSLSASKAWLGGAAQGRELQLTGLLDAGVSLDDVKLRDLDGDGDLDLSTHQSYFDPEGLHLFIGDGMGAFSYHHVPFGTLAIPGMGEVYLETVEPVSLGGDFVEVWAITKLSTITHLLHLKLSLAGEVVEVLGTSELSPSEIGADSTDGQPRALRFGDANGDGMDDVFVVPRPTDSLLSFPSEAEPHIDVVTQDALGLRLRTSIPLVHPGWPIYTVGAWGSFEVFDIDGDGLDDVLYGYSKTSKLHVIHNRSE